MTRATPGVSDHRTRHDVCPNCGTTGIAAARFCPACGQENRSLDVSFGHLLGEVVEHTLHLDSTFFRTTAALLLRPGYLTAEFIAGRRTRYVSPVRLYVVMSFLFFLLLALLPGEGGHEGGRTEELSISLYGMTPSQLVGRSQAEVDALLRARGVEPSAFNRYLAQKLVAIGGGGRAAFNHFLVKSTSYMMFALMPLFALLVFVAFRHRVHWYQRALICSVHLHSFLFLLLSAALLATRLGGGNVVPFVFAGAVLLYAFVSLRRLFGEGALATGLKLALVGVVYLLSMIAAFIASVLVSILLFSPG